MWYRGVNSEESHEKPDADQEAPDPPKRIRNTSRFFWNSAIDVVSLLIWFAILAFAACVSLSDDKQMDKNMETLVDVAKIVCLPFTVRSIRV
jgi:hypothetical protein